MPLLVHVDRPGPPFIDPVTPWPPFIQQSDHVDGASLLWP